MNGDATSRSGAPSTRLRGVLTRHSLDMQSLLERTTILANTLQEQALSIIEQKGADMTAAEAQRVLRLFLLRRLLLEGADAKELAAMGKEISSLFPPARANEGELKVSV